MPGRRLTVLISAFDSWAYFVVGSVIEAALLAAIAWLAWTWPAADRPSTASAAFDRLPAGVVGDGGAPHLPIWHRHGGESR